MSLRINMLALLIVTSSWLQAQEGWKDIYTYSELKDLNPQEFSDGEIKGVRSTVEGSGLTLGTESCFLVPCPPEKFASELQNYTTKPVREEGLIRQRMSNPARKEDFAALAFPIDRDDSLFFAEQSAKSAHAKGTLNLGKNGRQSISQALGAAEDFNQEDLVKLASAWQSILTDRSQAFQKGGLLGSPDYLQETEKLQLGVELLRTLKSKPKVLQHFSGILDGVMAGRTVPGTSPTVYYWDYTFVQKQPVLTAGGFFIKPMPGNGCQIAQVSYYSSSQYYLSLALYEAYPITINGKPSSLVWRGDYVITPSVLGIKGIERVAAGNIMLLEIKKDSKAFLSQLP